MAAPGFSILGDLWKQTDLNGSRLGHFFESFISRDTGVGSQ
jgi:hypothetical protein